MTELKVATSPTPRLVEHPSRCKDGIERGPLSEPVEHPTRCKDGIERGPLSEPLAQKVSLLIADVDGTLVTKEKILTERAQEAVRRLREAGIAFAVTSGRPPRGMSM